MANIAISALTAATTAGSTDVLPLVQGGVTKKVAVGVLTPDGSTTTKGLVEFATNAETATGAATGLAVTPAGAASAYVPKTRAVAATYAATVTPNADTTDVLNVGALTGALALANPTGTPLDGQNLRVRLAQDATGSRAITFGTAYAFGTDVTAALIPTAASAKWEMLFTWHAGDSKWRATAIVRGF